MSILKSTVRAAAMALTMGGSAAAQTITHNPNGTTTYSGAAEEVTIDLLHPYNSVTGASNTNGTAGNNISVECNMADLNRDHLDIVVEENHQTGIVNTYMGCGPYADYVPNLNQPYIDMKLKIDTFVNPEGKAEGTLMTGTVSKFNGPYTYPSWSKPAPITPSYFNDYVNEVGVAALEGFRLGYNTTNDGNIFYQSYGPSYGSSPTAGYLVLSPTYVAKVTLTGPAPK